MDIREKFFQVAADRLIEAASIFGLSAQAGNISAQAPIEPQHLIIHFHRGLDLALFEAFADFLNPVAISAVAGKKFAHRGPPFMSYVKNGVISFVLYPKNKEVSIFINEIDLFLENRQILEENVSNMV